MTEEQRRVIHKWLYDEPLPYREISKRAREEFGFDISHAAIGRMYQHELKFVAADEVADGQSAAEVIAEAGANLGQIRASSQQLIGVRLLQKAMDNGDTKEIAALGRLVLDAEEREIQRERTTLARERFQFKASKAALDACLAQEINRDELERERARIEMIKNKLFWTESSDECLPVPAVLEVCYRS